MNWQCPRCETFNRAAEKQCEVCEFAKPPKRAAAKTAIKDTTLKFFPLPDSTRSGGALVKPAEKSSIRITDRRSVELTKSAASDDKSAASKSSAPPEVSTPPEVQSGEAISPNTAFVLFLLWIAGNIYLFYDLTFNQEVGVGSWILGMVFGNIIFMLILGVIGQFITWVINLLKQPE